MPPVQRVVRSWRALSPPSLFVTAFASQIAIGTLGLLLLPGLYAGPGLSFVDALFTMTSATCVTGLIVADTATYFTFWGQLWILLFIQVGGLSLLTIATFIAGVLGRRLSLRSELLAVAGPQTPHGRDLVRLLLRLSLYTFAFELGIALLLWVQWLDELGAGPAAWHALFQAVSAFCNAGFSTFSDSLSGFAGDASVLLPISLLIIVGGFGFLSSGELWRWARAKAHQRTARLSAHTFAAAVTTIALLVAGTGLYAAFEWHDVLAPMSGPDKLLNAWFMAVTARTAGFNSVSYAELTNPSAFLTILLMGIGGSPGSTAGGIKTTAFAVMAAMAYARVRGRRFVEIHQRAVPDGTVQRTASLVIVFFAVVTVVLFILTVSETAGVGPSEPRRAFLPLLFEAMSASATVGLSMGATAALSSVGKLVVVVAMFVGRVGPLAFFAVMSLKVSGLPPGFRPAREDVVVG